MTTPHHFLRLGLRTPRFPAFLALACILIGARLSAATISWSGAGGDELWSNPTNWNGGVLPTSDDDVVINVPGAVTVRMDLLNTIVRSLQCQESFHIEYGGSLRVTGGSSFINGAFRVSPNYWGLEVHGPGTVLTFNGPITNIVLLSALAGGIINLPTAGQLTVDATWPFSYGSGLYADGVGSAIVMTNLTNLIIAPGYYFAANASGGARIDLRRLQVPDGPIQVTAQNPDSLIDLSGFSGPWAVGPGYGWRGTLTASDGGAVLVPNVTAIENVDVSVAGMTNVALNQIRSFSRGTLSLTSRTNGLNALTNFSGTLSVSDTRLDWTNFTVLHATNDSININAYNSSVVDLSRASALLASNGFARISAQQNSTIDLSDVTNVVSYASYGSRADASSGGRIDLRRLRVPEGPFRASADGADSVVDLSGLTGEWAAPGSIYGPSGVTAKDGGTLLISNVTSMRYLSLDIRDDAAVPTIQIRSFTDGGITLYGRTNGLQGLTNFSGAIDAYQSTRLDLTNFTTLYATNNSLTFSASGSSYIDLSRLTNVVTMDSGYGIQATAYSGSRIDLSGVRTSPELNVSATTSGADSLVDLSSLSGTWRRGSLSADSGGTILIPNVTSIEGGSVNVSGDANVDLAQVVSFTDGSLTLTGRTNDFLGLTNLAGTSIGITDSHLVLTNVTTLYTTNNHRHISANNGSLIDLSRVTNWVSSGWQLYVYAYNGSRVDLSRLPTPEWPFYVDVQGAGSVVDLSGFSGLWSGYGSVRAYYGATVLISNVTAMENISLDLEYDASVPIAQIGSYNGGSITLYVQTNVFTALTNFTGTVNCSYLARAEFPGLTEVVTASTPCSFAAYSDSLILLPNLETVVGGNVDVAANGAGALVDLSGLTGFFSASNEGSLSALNGGTILLSTNAMLLAGVEVNLQSNPGDILPPFLAPSDSVVLYGRPWQGYRIESRHPEAGSPWTLYARVALTSPLQTIGPRPLGNVLLRVSLILADPPEVDLRRAGPGFVEPILFGLPGHTYRLESRLALGSGDWEFGPAQALTNSFFISPASGTTNAARFYRARQLN